MRGEMSLVGPRPPIPYEVEHYPAHWFERFLVKPGVTGLWQVSGRSEVSLEEMIELDVDYVRRRSVLLNIWILLRTVPAVLSHARCRMTFRRVLCAVAALTVLGVAVPAGASRTDARARARRR